MTTWSVLYWKASEKRGSKSRKCKDMNLAVAEVECTVDVLAKWGCMCPIWAKADNG